MIESSLGLPATTAAEVVARYPLSTYPGPPLAFAAVGTDDSFACYALTADESLSKYVPTYSYEFNDENAPERYEPPAGFSYGAAHESEVQYLSDLSKPPIPVPSPINSRDWPRRCGRTGRTAPRTDLRPLGPFRHGETSPAPVTRQCHWIPLPPRSKRGLALTTTAHSGHPSASSGTRWPSSDLLPVSRPK